MEEWTKEETGVGAAIAAGNQAENGIWALLVIAAIIKNIHKKKESYKFKKFIYLHLPIKKDKEIQPKIKTSPIRLVKAVIIPALKDLKFW